MRSSVRSRLAPPSFQALRSDSNAQSVPFCSNKQFHNFRLAGKLPHSSSGVHPVRGVKVCRGGMLIRASFAQVCFLNFSRSSRVICASQQRKTADESESFAEFSAFAHSRPRALRSDLFMQHDCTDICSPRYISTFSKSLIQRYFSRNGLGGGGGESLSACPGDRRAGFPRVSPFQRFFAFCGEGFYVVSTS
jgi:hypothetical protein